MQIERLASRGLETWLAADISMVSDELMVIGRQLNSLSAAPSTCWPSTPMAIADWSSSVTARRET